MPEVEEEFRHMVEVWTVGELKKSSGRGRCPRCWSKKAATYARVTSTAREPGIGWTWTPTHETSVTRRHDHK
jgi:hypothetical protein